MSGKGLSFLHKKTWHTQRTDNIEKKWLLEQKKAAEDRKIEDLRKEREEDRQVEELRRLQELATGKKQAPRLDWMYEVPKARDEEHLLGKPVEGSVDESEVKQVAAVPGANFLAKAVTSSTERFARLNEDPLVAIKRQERAAREAVLNNPVKMREIQRRVRAEGAAGPRLGAKYGSESSGGSSGSLSRERLKKRHRVDETKDGSRHKHKHSHKHSHKHDRHDKRSKHDKRERHDKRDKHHRRDRHHEGKSDAPQSARAPKDRAAPQAQDRGDAEAPDQGDAGHDADVQRPPAHSGGLVAGGLQAPARPPQAVPGPPTAYGINHTRDPSRVGVDRSDHATSASLAQDRARLNQLQAARDTSLGPGGRRLGSSAAAPRTGYAKVLTPEEKARRLQEMMDTAHANDKARMARVTHAAAADAAEGATLLVPGAPSFLSAVRQEAITGGALDGAVGGGASVADALKRKTHYIQRGGAES
mmetsp:Transcript_22139/g.59721  ORF Transcript_22139/g.59721 Transcript_22139/m.59721 type:complete len:474 (-) Transcript_22139:439-1860(-)